MRLLYYYFLMFPKLTLADQNMQFARGQSSDEFESINKCIRIGGKLIRIGYWYGLNKGGYYEFIPRIELGQTRCRE